MGELCRRIQEDDDPEGDLHTWRMLYMKVRDQSAQQFGREMIALGNSCPKKAFSAARLPLIVLEISCSDPVPLGSRGLAELAGFPRSLYRDIAEQGTIQIWNGGRNIFLLKGEGWCGETQQLLHERYR